MNLKIIIVHLYWVFILIFFFFFVYILSALDTDIKYKIYSINGEVIARIPDGIDVTETTEGLILESRIPGIVAAELSGYKVSNLKIGSRVIFVIKDGSKTIEIKGEGDLEADEKKLVGVKNGNFKLNKDGKIVYAKFVSAKGGKGGIFKLSSEQAEYEFRASINGEILFDLEKREISGKDTNLFFRGNLLESNDFSAKLDEKGEIEFIKSKGKTSFSGYEGYIGSSDASLDVFLKGQNIEKSNVPAISFSRNNENYNVDAKGIVKLSIKGGEEERETNAENTLGIEEKTKIIDEFSNLNYEGKNNDAYVKFDSQKNNFELKAGNAIIDNEKHSILIENGNVKLLLKNLGSDSSGKTFQSFSFQVYKGNEEIRGEINEFFGKYTISSYKDGKETEVVIDLYKFDREEILNNPLSIQNRIKAIDEKIKTTQDPKERVVYELAKAKLENIINLDNKNFDAAIKIIEKFLDNPDTREFARLEIGKIYGLKISDGAKSLPERGNFFLETENGHRIEFQSRIVDGVERLFPVSRDAYSLEIAKALLKEKGDSLDAFKNLNGGHWTLYRDSFGAGGSGRDAVDTLRGISISGTSITESDVYKSMRLDFERAISYYDAVKKSSIDENNNIKNIKEYSEASLGIAQSYLAIGESGKARDELYVLSMRKGINKDIISNAYAGIGLIDSLEGRGAKALQNLEYAYSLSPQDERTNALLQNAYSNYLRNIDSKIDQEFSSIAKMADSKIGIARAVPDLTAGYPNEELQTELGEVRGIKDNLKKGVEAAQKIIEKGLFQEYARAGTIGERNEIVARAFGTTISGKYSGDDRGLKLYTKGLEMLRNNPDFALLVAAGDKSKAGDILATAGDVKIAVGDTFYGKKLSDYANKPVEVSDEFRFSTGESYLNAPKIGSLSDAIVGGLLNWETGAILAFPVGWMGVLAREVPIAGRALKALDEIKAVASIEGKAAIFIAEQAAIFGVTGKIGEMIPGSELASFTGLIGLVSPVGKIEKTLISSLGGRIERVAVIAEKGEIKTLPILEGFAEKKLAEAVAKGEIKQLEKGLYEAANGERFIAGELETGAEAQKIVGRMKRGIALDEMSLDIMYRQDMIDTMQGIRGMNPGSSVRFARNPGRLEVFSEGRGAQLVDESGARLVLAEITPYKEGIAIRTITTDVRGEGRGQELIDKLLEKYGVVYTGRQNAADTISYDARNMIYRLADDPRYRVEGTGIETEWNSLGYQKLKGSQLREIKQEIPEHVRITLAEEGSAPTGFRFRTRETSQSMEFWSGSTSINAKSSGGIKEEQGFLEVAKTEEFREYPINENGLKKDYKDKEGIFNRNPTITTPGGKNSYTTYEAWRDAYFGNVGRSVNLENNLKDGRFIFYGKAAGEENGVFIWAIDNQGNFGLASRPTVGYTSLPHPVLAGGNPVFGAGEITFKDGMVYAINAFTGHYYDIANPEEFTRNAIKAFERYAEIKGLKLHPDFVVVKKSLVY